MAAELVTANVVIAGAAFNPSVFGQLWLVQNEIVRADEFELGSAFTDYIVQVQTKAFSLQVLAHQLTFAPLDPEAKAGALIRERVGRIVELLPHTPFVAVGANFVWRTGDLSDCQAITRRLFGRSGGLYDRFESDAYFGAYLSKSLGPARLRLDARPIVFPASATEPAPEAGSTLRLQFSFNVERRLNGEGQAKIPPLLEMLEQWESHREATRELTAATLQEVT